jgi:dipeptidyl-peptidase-4
MRFRSQTLSLLLSFALLVVVAIAAAPPCAAQQASAASPVAVTDYQRAEKFLGHNTSPLVLHRVRLTWLPNDDRFWYRDAGPDGFQFVLYDAASGTHRPAFDHDKLATALSAAAGKTYEASHLPFMTFDFSPDQHSISFTLRGQTWNCDLQANTCASEAKAAAPHPEAKSPDGKTAAFIRDWNLWTRDVATGKETQLTTDGVRDFGYATDNAGWIHSDRPILLWSPDSKKIATFQQDQRGTGEMYLVETKIGHPKLEAGSIPFRATMSSPPSSA